MSAAATLGESGKRPMGITVVMAGAGLICLLSAWGVGNPDLSPNYAALGRDTNTLTFMGVYFLALAVINLMLPLLRKYLFRQPTSSSNLR